MKQAGNDYVGLVGDLRNAILTEDHPNRIKLYSDAALGSSEILSHVVSSKTVMKVQNPLRLVDKPNGLKVWISWSRLPPVEDTKEPLKNFYNYFPDMLVKFLRRQVQNGITHWKSRTRVRYPRSWHWEKVGGRLEKRWLFSFLHQKMPPQWELKSQHSALLLGTIFNLATSTVLEYKVPYKLVLSCRWICSLEYF